jgi:hypothetical protein
MHAQSKGEPRRRLLGQYSVTISIAFGDGDGSLDCTNTYLPNYPAYLPTVQVVMFFWISFWISFWICKREQKEPTF